MSTCAARSGTLCSGNAADVEAAVTLIMASAPERYDVRSHPFPVQRLNPAFDQQECNLCVGAAAVAAAEAAVASVLTIPASSVRLSPSYLYYCSAKSGDNSCTSGWTLAEALEALTSENVPSFQCHGNVGTSIYESGRKDLLCPKKTCPLTPAAQGKFRWRKLSTL